MSFLTTRGKNQPVLEQPVERSYKQKILDFGQSISDLEDENVQLRTALNDITVIADTAKARIKDLETDRDALKKDNVDLSNKWRHMETTLKNALSLLLDAVKQQAPQDRFRPNATGMRAVEKAIATTKALDDPDSGKPIPDFLKQDEQSRD